MSSKRVKIRFGGVLIWCVAVIFASNFFVQRTSYRYWYPSDKRLLKLYALDTDPENYDVLILGSSITDYGFIPVVMEEEMAKLLPDQKRVKVFNASIHAGLLPSQLDVMRNIVGVTQKPKVVLLMLGVRDFNGSGRYDFNWEIGIFTKSLKDLIDVLLYSNDNKTRYRAISAFTRGLETIMQMPLLFDAANRELIDEFQTRHSSGYYYPFTESAKRKNYEVYSAPDTDLMESMKLRAYRIVNNDIWNFEINKMITGWLEEINDEAKKKGVELIVIFAPESAWLFSRVYPVEKQKAKNYLNEFCRVQRTVCFDAGYPPLKPLDSDYRDGCNHLSPEGAEKFSRSVARYILAPMF